jgi:hypothetical protein
VSGGSAIWCRRTPLARLILLVFAAAFNSSCSPPPEKARDLPLRPPSPLVKKISLPNGWSLVSREENTVRPDIHLVRDDNDASMIIRELRPVALAKRSLGGEDLCVLGNISMQGKLGKEGTDRKILRSPTVIGKGKQSCVYIYSENSLLRRVVVFRTRSAIYEVELFQDVDALSLAKVVDAQSAVVRGLMEGE